MSESQLSTFLLVAADKMAMREELAAALAPLTMARVTTAVSVAEAVSDLQMPGNRTDLAIIDLEMSGSGAVTLTRKIREAQTLGPRNIAILLVGGAVGTVHYQAAARLGIQGHLPHPLTADRLRTAVRAALEARPTGSLPRSAPVAVRRDMPAPSKPVIAESKEPAKPVPVANKPFHHGLQSLIRSPRPLTDDDGFGFDPFPVTSSPRLPSKSIADDVVIVRGRPFIAVA